MSQLPDGSYPSNQPDRDPTPWGSGIAVATLVGLLTALAVYAFGSALAEVHPLLAVAVNVVAAGGAAPSVWRWRWTPVTRWVLAGGVAGVLLGWFVLLVGAVF
ncbi:DUF2537 domain-containing protein [Nocardia arthritidis]|uniref:DUF2537 domain-containing protein n=1 Tax=Nocardia arthritidis TaxID=228602 RepID=A0A6G9Y5W3_9NOCA|nr:DUF2537 domain-containing protein [Nocardia arthritidis]QIS08635.1 DUF2537 domain-containing protein [Nocardia arthritidis]